MKKLLDDCFLHDADRLRHDAAIAILKARVRGVAGPETVPLSEACGRILAGPVQAMRPIPAHTNAAVDGYAFAFRDYDAGQGSLLPVAGRVTAGHPLATAAITGHAARIFTGAMVPDGLDTIVMQEDIETVAASDGARTPPSIRIPSGLNPGANVRLRGEDVATGAGLFAAGHCLRPQDLAAMASAGHGQARCFAKIRVGVFSTGDEVVRPGAAPGLDLSPGQIYDANAPMLMALIASAGASPVDLGILPDDAGIVRARLLAAGARYDALITSGGASRGEEDHVVRTLDAIGHLHMWQIAIKPGRPMSFGQIGDCVFVGLPGNPVAVFVCFLLYVWPMLRALGGGVWPEPMRLRLRSVSAVTKRPGRREYWRASLVMTPDGLAVEKFARDGSGLITSLRVADGLIEADEDTAEIAAGDRVNFIPFTQFGIAGRVGG